MKNKLDIIIRPFTTQDRSMCGELFYQTVHTICSKDYSKEQLDIWAPEVSKSGNFPRPLENNFAYVSVIDNLIVGFADITKEGYLDRFFVHKDYQGLGIGKKLLETIEKKAKDIGLKEISLEASSTARPFFAKMGYQVIRKQSKMVKDIKIENYKMNKKLA